MSCDEELPLPSSTPNISVEDIDTSTSTSTKGTKKKTFKLTEAEFNNMIRIGCSCKSANCLTGIQWRMVKNLRNKLNDANENGRSSILQTILITNITQSQGKRKQYERSDLFQMSLIIQACLLPY